MTYVREIASEPHPAGSAAMAQVADYLQAELGDLRLEVKPLVMRDPKTGVVLHVVAGRLAGRDPTGAVLLVAHPDSVPMGPGAGDNATGAATLLESARALSVGRPLRNDVIFLFDDGEELGDYRGGHLFADHHPWMEDVKVAVGLDTAAWGVPFLMQDSEDNGALVRGYAEGVDHPVALGLDASTNRDDPAEIDTFRQRGIPGIEIEDTYADTAQHTAEDTSDRVNTDSLQMMGDQVLGATRSYGEMDLAHASAPDRAFFPVLGLGLVHYPAAWGWLLLVLGLLAVVMVLAAARRRELGLKGMALGLLGATALVVGAMLLAKVAATLYGWWQPDPRANTPSALGEYLVGSSSPFAVVALSAIAVVSAFAYRALARLLGTVGLGLGFLILWWCLGAVAFAVAPPGAYLFQWPLLAAAAAWWWLVRGSERSGLVLLVPLAVAALLLAPQLVLAYFGGGVAVLPMIALASLVLGFVGPALTRTPVSNRPA